MVGMGRVGLGRAQRAVGRALLIVAGIVPLLFGGMLLLPDDVFDWWVTHQLGGNVTPSPLLTYTKALLGFYLVGYAAVCFALARAPERNPWMVRGVGAFLVARGLQRNYLAGAMAGAFDIPVDAHLAPVVFTVCFGAAIIATTLPISTRTEGAS